MKNWKDILKGMCAVVVAFTVVSCDKEPGQSQKPRDPNDISGMYDVNYRMWIDGTAVSFGELAGRVEVFRASDDELSLDFYPDNAILKFPPVDYDTTHEYLTMWPVRPVGTAIGCTFGDYSSMVSLEVKENHATVGPLTMNGSIAVKNAEEWGVGAQYFNAGPGVYHRLSMTIDMWVPDPDLPSGTQIYPETGEGVRKFHIEIMSR